LYAEKRVEHRGYKRKWEEKNPDYQQNYRDVHRQERREYDFQRHYGISLEDYNRMCEVQENRCAICGILTKLVVDHNHLTQKVREGLCSACNLGIGTLREDPELLEKAAQYLRKHKEKRRVTLGGLPTGDLWQT